jgi:hypothetical protein
MNPAEKVMEHMRTCGTAIIHVAIDDVPFDQNGKEHLHQRKRPGRNRSRDGLVP